MKVLHTGVGRIKTVSTFMSRVGKGLDYDAMAVTFHALHSSTGSELMPEIKPRFADNPGTCVQIVTDFTPGCGLAVLEQSTLGWSPKGAQSLKFRLPLLGLADDESVNDAVSKLFAAGAVPSKGGVVQADPTAEPWKSLLEMKFVELATYPSEVSADEPLAACDVLALKLANLKLTSAALRQLTVCEVYTESCFLFKVRDELPLPDLTAWEMAKLLEQRGFEWQLMPRLVQDRRELMHSTLATCRAWYTYGHTLIKPYLQCLLSAEELKQKHNIMFIPHYAPSPIKNYGELLEGKEFSNAAQPTQRALTLKPEFEDDNDDAVLAREDEPDDGFGDYWHIEEDDEFVAALEMAIAEAEIERAKKHQGEEGDVNDDVGGDVNDDVGADDPAAGDPPPPPPQPGDRRKRIGLDQLPWGCFVIARKSANIFEARCPFHRRTRRQIARRLCDLIHPRDRPKLRHRTLFTGGAIKPNHMNTSATT